MPFKTPDGKSFETRAEWREYMMETFYTFKNKVNEPSPLVKSPGDIEGQEFQIADCEGSTLVIMDHSEQVQIDSCKNCRVFIGACASSIFIRNCESCVFYTCCRQLRLREVTKSTFYIYSMSEVHIEYSNSNLFAPFNGGYPEQARHFSSANLNPKHNLWYDIFDHNDPAKTGANWGLLPEGEYEAPWFPAGECEPAVARTAPGSVARVDTDGNMQSFGMHQLIADAQQISPTTAAPKSPPKASNDPAPPIPPLPEITEETDESKVISALRGHLLADLSCTNEIVVAAGSASGGQDISSIVSLDFSESKDMVCVSYLAHPISDSSVNVHGTAVLKKETIRGVDCGFISEISRWKLVRDHRSTE